MQWLKKLREIQGCRQEKMSYEVVGRSYSNHERKKLLVWAFFGCFVIALSFCAFLNSYMVKSPLVSRLNLKAFPIVGISNYKRENRDVVVEEVVHQVPAVICNFSDPRSDFCEINGDVSIHGNSSTIFVSSSLLYKAQLEANSTWKLRPYARKIDSYLMKKVREFSIGSPSSFGLNEMPKCSINHSVPAIVFSTSGHMGRFFFHDFGDVLVPLYINSRAFNGDVQFLVTDIKPSWLIKYEALLSSLSKYTIMDIDSSKEVHCFPRMIVGLKSHNEFGIDPYLTPQGYTMRNFTRFVRTVYSLRRNRVEPLRDGDFRKPRLLIISRKTSRRLVNEDEVAAEARSLGYDVVIVDAVRRSLQDFSKMVNSFDVMLGVHGAGLTNSIFLPENGILIQIVALGLEWLSKQDFQEPAIAMNLRYLDYKISWNESSLADKYLPEDPQIRNLSIITHGFPAFKKVYLDGQNVRIDVGRFRATLLKAIMLLRQ